MGTKVNVCEKVLCFRVVVGLWELQLSVSYSNITETARIETYLALASPVGTHEDYMMRDFNSPQTHFTHVALAQR